jgi:2-polyprenyl-6-methoxyphenol hydroxylase-like FAD-dependent oxidoreductase
VTKTPSNGIDVLVVGAGPVGLFLAAEVARYGLTVTVLERLTEPSRQIKAGAVGPQGAQLLDQRGLLDAFPQPDLPSPTGPRVGRAPTRPVGHFAGLWLLRGVPGARTSPIFAPQYEVEVVLDQHARRHGVHLLRGRELVGFVETEEGVTAQIAGPKGRGELTAKFLIGADGGRSLVRRLSGVRFDGTDPTITGRQGLVEMAEPNPLAKGWHRTEHGMVVFGPDPRRILTVEFDGPPSDRDAPVTAAEVQASLRRVSGTDVTVTHLHTGTRWTDHTRLARDYRHGRVLLAGDAAHVHPPFGGQGLTLGLQDAANLGWKLAATVQGWAGPGLLDSYCSERKPAAATVLANTRAQVALMRPDPQTTALRDLFAELLALDDANVHVSKLMTGTDRPYPMTNNVPDVGTAVEDQPIHERGERTRLYEILRSAGGVLVDNSGDGRWSATAGGWSLRVRSVRDSHAGRSLLVRPDGVLAWTDQDPDGLECALRTWFGAAAHERTTRPNAIDNLEHTPHAGAGPTASPGCRP